MNEEIYDLKLQHKYQSALGKNPKHAALLKSQLYCGTRLITQPGMQPGAFVMSNGQIAKFFGIASCKNAWSCPHCSTKLMAKYASEIAIAIDALKEKGQIAFMLTLTIPHTRGMSCEESTEILYNSWKAFIVRGNHNLKNSYYLRSNGKRKFNGTNGKDVFASFCEQTGCRHRVRVGEYTWGDAGWHPHFHCLFWVDKDKFDKVLDWHDKFQERWLQIVKRETLKIWNKRAKDDAEIARNKTRLEIMYSRLNEVSKAAYMSINDDGKLIVQQSSMYICGWGADRELTSNFERKATNPGHLTPFQILEKATDDPDDKWMKLYLEYAWATRIKRHARINFSVHSGIKKIIAQWKLTKQYQEVCKKKAATDPTKNLKLVCWFDKSSWSDICFLNRNFPIKAEILELAKLPDAYERIRTYLMKYGIDVRREYRNEAFINSLFAA